MGVGWGPGGGETGRSSGQGKRRSESGLFKGFGLVTSPSSREIGGLPEEEMAKLSSSSRGEGGVFLVEGTACTKAWQQNCVCNLGSHKHHDVARMESECGVGAQGQAKGRSWVLMRLWGFWPGSIGRVVPCNGDKGGRLDLGERLSLIWALLGLSCPQTWKGGGS